MDILCQKMQYDQYIIITKKIIDIVFREYLFLQSNAAPCGFLSGKCSPYFCRTVFTINKRSVSLSLLFLLSRIKRCSKMRACNVLLLLLCCHVILVVLEAKNKLIRTIFKSRRVNEGKQ